MTSDALCLHEELMLLALRDDEGTVAGGTMYQYAIGGGLIAELVMAQRVTVLKDPKRQLLRVLDPTPLSDPLVDEWLRSMAESKKEREVYDWVSRIASTKDLKHRVASQLARRGVLRTSEGKVLWIFTRKTYPELDPKPEHDVVARLEAAIFEDGEVDPRTAVLAAIAHNCGILPVVFDKKRLKGRKSRLSQIAEGLVAAGATADAIAAMQTAIMVAVIIPAVITPTIVSS